MLAEKIQGPVAVIGDVHGQSTKLASVLSQLRQLADYQDRWIVFIGDYVDRGPDTAGCIEQILQLCQEHPRTTALCGNHEYQMGRALGWWPGGVDETAASHWVTYYDSDVTLGSYGVEPGDLAGLAACLPATHQTFLAELPWMVEHPQYLFVHAGLAPIQPVALQKRILQHRDYTLTKPQWLYSKVYSQQEPPQDCLQTVVCGHVFTEQVVITPRRILTDTTGGQRGELSCVLLPERRVLASRPGAMSPAGRPPQTVSSPGPKNATQPEPFRAPPAASARPVSPPTERVTPPAKPSAAQQTAPRPTPPSSWWRLW